MNAPASLNDGTQLSTAEELDRALFGLRQAAKRWARQSLDARVALIDRCIAGVTAVAAEWVEAACRAKRIPATSPARAEEIVAGPVATIRQLRLLARTFADLQATGRPCLPGKVQFVQGQARVPIFPTPELFDSLLFRPMTAEAWLQRDVEPDRLHGDQVSRLLHGEGDSRVVVVLGAGNVSSIPATDALSKIFAESHPVLLKMNPVNAYLGPIFERAFESLIASDLLRIVYGGADVGSYLVGHAQTDEVHITGSIGSHDAIVWGSSEDEQQRRKKASEPLLQKRITSELGNVSPWAIVPGRYSPAQLRAQAESVVASITNNASFNCVATKVIVTNRNWSQRSEFCDLVSERLAGTPRRYAYYPGAADRYERFAGTRPDDSEWLPWTLLRNVDPDRSPELLQSESFVGVCAEVVLDADSPTDFLRQAVEMLNRRLWGSLAATITLPPGFQREMPQELDDALRALRYGVIGLNQWAGVAFAWMSPPWGGHPCGTLADAQSGIGTVHNTYLLDRPEKTILRAPLILRPKPIWFTSHRHPESLAWNLWELYRRPSATRLPSLLWRAFTA